MPDWWWLRRPSIGCAGPYPRPAMQVTEEDGGRLNAFAKEPRMVVMEEGESQGGNRLLLIGGAVLVLALVALAAGIS